MCHLLSIVRGTDESSLSAWSGEWPARNSVEETRLVAEMLRLATDVAARLSTPSAWADAADAASAALSAVVEKLRTGVHVENLAGYLAVAVRHAVLDDQRKNRRLRDALVGDIDDSPQLHHDAPELVDDDVEAWFDRLRRSRPRMKDGEVVLSALRLIEGGYTQDEVALRLGLSRNNLSHKLSAYGQALRDLRRRGGWSRWLLMTGTCQENHATTST